ncbi:MAG: DUF4389 domain-containing protein [Candidatus Micrarchaeota archaeon]|nr:DUF4389 domain-containing protein [Candidatus Micrarchaeota archaeon]
MKGVEVNPIYKEESPRLELLYRVGYFIIYYIIGMILSFLLLIAWPLQVIWILITGKRQNLLHKIIRMFTEYVTEYIAYLYCLTDERPRLLPNFDSLK